MVKTNDQKKRDFIDHQVKRLVVAAKEIKGRGSYCGLVFTLCGTINELAIEAFAEICVSMEGDSDDLMNDYMGHLEIALDAIKSHYSDFKEAVESCEISKIIDETKKKGLKDVTDDDAKNIVMNLDKWKEGRKNG